MYKKIIVACACLLAAGESSAEQIVLGNGIGLVDGIFITGELVGAVFKIARDIQSMQLGRRVQQGRVGMYQFEGAQHCIRTLAQIEKTCTKNSQRILQLNQLLATMKQDFNNIVSPFLELARGAKGPMTLVISDWCDKRNCPKSLLLNWSSSDDDEMVAFDKSVTSFVLFDDFCTDLVTFLGDLINSCPKARAQFEQLKKDYLNKQSKNQ